MRRAWAAQCKRRYALPPPARSSLWRESLHLDLDLGVAIQLAFHGGSRGQAQGEMAPVFLVEGGEVIEVAQKNGGLHHVGHARAAFLQRRGDALQYHPRLGHHVARVKNVGTGVHRQLSRDEQESAGAHRLGKRNRHRGGITLDFAHAVASWTVRVTTWPLRAPV